MRNIIYLLVEGASDRRFMDKIIKPLLVPSYYDSPCFEYKQVEKIELNNFIDYIKGQSIDYYVFADYDDSSSLDDIINETYDYFEHKISKEKIIIIKKEIESWYLAGLDDHSCKHIRMKVSTMGNTENMSKEDFYDLKPEDCDSMINFYMNILIRYDLKIGISKNTTLKYFIELIR